MGGETNLRKLEPGQAITDGWVRAVVDAIHANRITVVPPLKLLRNPAGSVLSIDNAPLIRHATLGGSIQPGGGSPTDGTAGTDVDYFPDGETPEEKWTDGPNSWDHVIDGHSGVYLQGERHALWWQPDAGAFIPMPGMQIHLAEAYENIDVGESGFAMVYKVVDEFDDTEDEIEVESTGILVKVWDYLGDGAYEGENLYVWQHRQSRLWYFWRGAGESSPIRTYLKERDCCDRYKTTSDPYGNHVCYGPFNLDAFSTTGTGTAWTNPSNAQTSGGGEAAADGITGTGDQTQLLKCLDIVTTGGYAPAANFEPKVVTVRVTRRDENGAQDLRDEEVKLVIGGTTQADNKAVTTDTWSQGSLTVPYVFETGATLSRADSLASDFGVVIRGEKINSTAYRTSIVDAAMDAADYSGPTTFSNDTAANGSKSMQTVSGQLELTVDCNANVRHRAFTTNSLTDATEGAGQGFVVDPSVTGNLASVYISFDWDYDSSDPAGNETTIYAICTQGGSQYLYEVAGNKSPGDSGSFAKPMKPTDWQRIGGGDEKPDYSLFAASPLHFGFGHGHTCGATSYEAVVLYDNFDVRPTDEGDDFEANARIDHVTIEICGNLT